MSYFLCQKGKESCNLCKEDNSLKTINKFRYLRNIINNEGA